MAHRTLKDLVDRKLKESNLESIGAVYYILHIISESASGEYEVHKFYEAKMILLSEDISDYPKNSKERKRAEKKFESARSGYKSTDSERDLPF